MVLTNDSRLPNDSRESFDVRKLSSLDKLNSDLDDNSVKSYIDMLCVPFIDLLNKHNDYYTTSSCSGRISILSLGKQEVSANDSSPISKGSCWIFNSHSLVNDIDLTVLNLKQCAVCNNTDLHSTSIPLIFFKFEPFIMHVEARTPDTAHLLLTTALNAGYRNSGCSIHSKRCMIAIRHSTSINVPIGYKCFHDQVKYIVSRDYLKFLFQISNQYLSDNFTRMEKLLVAMKECINAQSLPNKETYEQRRERKRAEGLQRQEQLKKLDKR